MGWACVQTHGREERKAIENLQKQEFEAFCPMLLVPSRANIARRIEVPLFPSYAFVLIDFTREWACINNTIGCVRVLTTRDRGDPRPLFVPDNVIAGLGPIAANAACQILPPGAMVRVRDRNSPLWDHEGRVVDEMGSHDRIRVLMGLFNGEVVVEFEAPSLELL